MAREHTKIIALELELKPGQIKATVDLLDNDATVPFIARYRKEATGGLDEVAIMAIRNRITQLRDLDKRREAILKSLTERELLTDELKKQIESAATMAALEDIYLPYRPRKRTRATMAIERGLEPLAELIFEQGDIDPAAAAEPYVNPDNEVNTSEDALAGARDIIAAWINEDTDARARIRELYRGKGMICSRVVSGKEDEGYKYEDYFDWRELHKEAPSYRILAMFRGETEGILNLKIEPPEDTALAILLDLFIDGDSDAARQVAMAIEDSFKRLLGPAMETEMRQEMRHRADREAIGIFADNLTELLMAPALGPKNILAIDPGFRTGCKVACLDKQGRLNHHVTIFPHNENKKMLDDAGAEIKALCEKYKINVIAVGNGTAGRETVAFLKTLELPGHIAIEMVNEAGASVYSASEVAREEFPDHDVTVRGAVSIGRRLMDPLAELVKIDPKAIGVGQYQHDVDQSALKQGLDDTVSSCVNAVGVEVNTASKQLLTYVSGLGPQLAQNIINFRDENGPFKSRENLKRVPRLGPKAFEQCAGFLRINKAENPLDRSAVHPESYHVVEQMAKDLDCTVEELMHDAKLRERIDLPKYVTEKVGLPTLNDITAELAKPGRDPREAYEPFSFDDSVHTIEDLKVGMVLPGIITNVTQFGAFVDIGVHQDGLVHISELSDSFVKDPTQIVKLNQRVKVKILNVEVDRGRIALSMKGLQS